MFMFSNQISNTSPTFLNFLMQYFQITALKIIDSHLFLGLKLCSGALCQAKVLKHLRLICLLSGGEMNPWFQLLCSFSSISTKRNKHNSETCPVMALPHSEISRNYHDTLINRANNIRWDMRQQARSGFLKQPH